MRLYIDSSALLKRVFSEPESPALIALLKSSVQSGDVLIASTLAWIEVSRSMRAYEASQTGLDVGDLIDVALSGVLEKPITSEVAALARRLNPPVLRTLDAIHLASALLVDADVLVAYDQRLIEAAAGHGLRSLSPPV